MSQESFADSLLEQTGLNELSVKTNPTPYRSGYPVDAIPINKSISIQEQNKLTTQYRSLIGSLLWLSQGTRPDLATITNVLAKYQSNPTQQHIDSAKYVIKYIKGTKDMGITFDTIADINLTSFIHFPIKSNKITGICDANWGPQDQSVPNPSRPKHDLDLFKTRSISGHLITLHGPLHWVSKRQKVTARSSCEAARLSYIMIIWRAFNGLRV